MALGGDPLFLPASRFGDDFLKRRILQNTLDQPVGHPDMPVPQSVLVSLPDCGIKNVTAQVFRLKAED
jgi:hypothetical protein